MSAVATIEAIDAAIKVINAGIQIMTALKVSAPIMQGVSDKIQRAITENRVLTPQEIASIKDEARSELQALGDDIARAKADPSA